MGACYSKSGQDVLTDREKRPRERKKNSQKNGHTGSFKTDRLVLDIPIQKDLSDTVYTEDSHFVVTDVSNCINKSQQTSLDRLTRDANKNIENLTGCEVIEQNDLVVISDTNVNTRDDSRDDFRDMEDVQKNFGDMSRHLETTDGKVSTSDSGIVVENCKGCEHIEQNFDGKDEFSESFETHLDSLENETNLTGVNKQEIIQRSCSCSNSKICDSQRQRIHADHSNTNSCHEGENRQSVASLDRLSESNKTSESTTDLDKIRLAIRQNSLGTPTEQRSFLDGSEISYDLPQAVHQPEVTTMTMNGRDVVVIDAELFSQIIDEIQNLKMKLSQLTEVIQDDEDMEDKTSISILSSSA